MKTLSVSLPVALLASILLGASPGGCQGQGGPQAAATVASSGGSGGGGSGGGGGDSQGDTAASAVARAKLISYEEVPANSTTGHGTFQATRSADGTTFTFELTYADLAGSTVDGGAVTVTGAHIHLGQRGVSGGIAVDLCGAGSTPACPPSPATVTGTFTAADVVGPTDQGLAAGDLDALIRAAETGVTYVNVHTSKFPKGEIRGQIRYRALGDHGDGDGEGDHDDDN